MIIKQTSLGVWSSEKKILKKLGSGWVGGSSLNSDFFFNLVFLVFFMLFFVVHVYKKYKNK